MVSSRSDSKQTRRQPEYFLIDRIPGSEIPHLLGRVVASRESPVDEYRPEDPRGALKGTHLEVVDQDFASLFWAEKNKAVTAKVCSILDVDVSRLAERQNEFAAKFIRTRLLPQHRDALKSLLDVHRSEVLSLLADNGGVGYMIVGIKSCLDGSTSNRISNGAKRSLAINLPTSDAIAAATHGIVTVGTAADVSVGVSRERATGADVTTTMVGEQVFALRYRRLALKKAFLSSKGAYVDYGQIERARFDAGVFDRSAA